MGILFDIICSQLPEHEEKRERAILGKVEGAVMFDHGWFWRKD